MSLKRRKKNKLLKRETLINDLAYRAFSVRSSTIDVEKRTIDATIATESPVLMPDYERGEMIPEVLLTSGVEIPASRQVPLLDSHARKQTSDQLGSARNLTTSSSDVSGTLHFSTVAESQWTKVREGHTTDVSAGYRVLHKTFVKPGESKIVGGQRFTGPVNVVDKWRIFEVSLVPIGADQQAKLRGFEPHGFEPQKGIKMDQETKELLVKRGMPADLDDAAADKWFAENKVRLLAEPEKKPEPTSKLTPIVNDKAIADQVREAIAAALAAERNAATQRETEIRELCDLAGLGEHFAEFRSLDVPAARAAIVKKKTELDAANPLPFSVKITGDGKQRFMADVGTALVMRAVDQAISYAPDNVCTTPEQVNARVERVREKAFPTAQRSAGAERWKHATPMQIAEECLKIDGCDTRGMSRDEIARATFDPGFAAQYGMRGTPALNTTGSFTNLTIDAVNKSMLVGYTQAPSTWEGPMRQGQSVQDFKQINRLKMGAIPNLPIWPDDTDPVKARFADAKERYAVESRSLEIGFSYRLLINDDLSALTRVPAMMGNAARRTVNAVAWSVITSNPTMSDGVALFSTATGARKRSNLTGGTNAITTANIQTAQNLMMQMRGENTPEGNEGADVLALMPKFLVAPSALYQSAIVVTRSSFDPVANQFQNYNIASQLTAVIEPLLDANSTTKWYLFADPAQIDTVEVTFLAGQENPIVRAFVDPQNLTQRYIILQTFAAAAMNHRGLQQASA